MSDILMKCNHVAQGTTQDGQPVCVICVGINPDATIIHPKPPELKGRISRCTYCGKEKASRYDLPFFNYRALLDRDTHYDGCRGWN